MVYIIIILLLTISHQVFVVRVLFRVLCGIEHRAIFNYGPVIYNLYFLRNFHIWYHVKYHIDNSVVKLSLWPRHLRGRTDHPFWSIWPKIVLAWPTNIFIMSEITWLHVKHIMLSCRPTKPFSRHDFLLCLTIRVHIVVFVISCVLAYAIFGVLAIGIKTWKP